METKPAMILFAKTLLIAASIFVASPSIGLVAEAQTAPPSTAPATPTPPIVDLELESVQQGHNVRLSSMRGKILVIFVEHREHTGDNESIKGDLERFIRDNSLGDLVTMIPVANANGYDFAPANSVVRTALRELAARIHMDVLIDWSLRFGRAPFSSRDEASNVFLISPRGELLFRKTGTLSATDRTELFRHLRQLVRASRGQTAR